MQDLLDLLSDGCFHSGEELGRVLGVTRAAIWKKLKKLDQMGIRLHSVKGKGYRLPEEIDLLSSSKLSASGLSIESQVHFSVASTNTEVTKFIQAGNSLPILIATELQTDGRGRRGRQWQGGRVGKNILMSIGWHFDQGVNVVEGLSLAIGVAVARVLKQFGTERVGLKWPNDILVGDKKICGILLEMVADQDSCDVVIGIGLNLAMDNQQMESVGQPWTDLASEIINLPERNKLLALLANEVKDVCLCFERGDGLTSYLTEWLQHDALKNKPVQVVIGEKTALGIARGINSSGALLLEKEGVLTAFNGGEVSVRQQ
ncbi:biotin--[acetyl-CoA-carboxylase] ligase [Marinomonas agarivorans]|nr:biotin--[acetyl-CoA-carboxylase] ligase [Marinomonas agarivorans]